ncbi:MAG: hypothetical protein R3B70_12020 [Polyangiaceae bacterium]
MTHRLLSASWLLCLASCSYDWTIGEPAAGGAGGESTAGGGGQTTSTTTATATTDTTTSPCDDLRADLAAKKKAAKACPSQGQLCTDLSGKDECGCDVSSVWDVSSAETAAYLDAVTALEQAGCQPSCGACGAGTPFCSPLSGELLCSP